MNHEERSAFALRLRMLRKKAHLTQADVADALNLHRTAYTKYETDRACPDQACLLILADLFHVTVDFLLGKENEGDPVAALQNAAAVVALSPEEEELVNSFRQLTDTQRRLLLQTERELIGNLPRENE
jgi:transcriptional regulator with XRE-family HTH domain